MITLINRKSKIISKLYLIRELEKYPLFTLKDLKDITNKDEKYCKLLLYRLRKDKLIFKIEKNKYTLHYEPLIFSSRLVWPAYISCWSAIRFYNLTEQLPQGIFVVTTRSRLNRNIKFNNIKIAFIKTKPNLFFGFTKENYNGFTIFIAEPEKALIDSILYRKISFSEIASMIKENIKELDVKKFISYLIKIKNKSLIKRFGYLFDLINLDYHNKLKKFLDNKYIGLDYNKPKEGIKNKKWRIIENVKL